MKPTSLLNAFLPVLLSVATYAATETTNKLGGITRILGQEDITAGLATPCPTGLEAEINYFDSTAIYARSAPLEKMNEDLDKSNLVAVARFIGQMRSRRIPDYGRLRVPANSPRLRSVQVSGTNFFNPGASTNPEVRKAYEKVLAELETENETFRLQQELEMEDVNLTPKLLETCSRLSTNDPANVELLRQVADAAHLTADERKKLGFVGQ
jgi:hypothetical protein